MAADNALVTPLAFSLPAAVDQRAQNKTQIAPKDIAATVTKIAGEMVEVSVEAQGNFTIPKITVPQGYSEWIRPPTQVGDKGHVISSDYYIGGQSNLGGGTANYYGRANLTPAVWHPVSQDKFKNNTNRDMNAVFLNGPNGVVMQDTKGQCVLTLTPTGIVIKIGGMTCTISAAGIDVEGGDIVNNGLTVGSTHIHGGVAIGGAHTGPPDP